MEMNMWNIITTPTSPNEKCNYFSLPLLNKYAPLMACSSPKQFPTFDELNFNVVKTGTIYNYNNCGRKIVNSMPPQEEEMVVKNHQLSKTTTVEELEPIITVEVPKKSKKRRRRHRHKKKKNNVTTATTKMIPAKSIPANSFKSQRTISTSSEDSFIIFGDEFNLEIDGNVEQYSENSSKSSPISTSDYDDDDSQEYVQISVKPKSTIDRKKVHFAGEEELCEVHPMVKWSYAYQAARRGPWEEYARDRDRFKKRIRNLETILNPILTSQHRSKIYQQRMV